MKISYTFPPNYPAILTAFPACARIKGVVFTYNQTLYNPYHTIISPDLMVHEETHAKQQYDHLGTDAIAESWWDRYIKFPDFRLASEVEAYRAQYAYMLKNYS